MPDLTASCFAGFSWKRNVSLVPLGDGSNKAYNRVLHATCHRSRSSELNSLALRCTGIYAKYTEMHFVLCTAALLHSLAAAVRTCTLTSYKSESDRDRTGLFQPLVAIGLDFWIMSCYTLFLFCFFSIIWHHQGKTLQHEVWQVRKDDFLHVKICLMALFLLTLFVGT